MNTGAALDRLFAGGRHVRFLMIGRPPSGMVLPELGGVERFVRVLRPGQTGPEAVVADPARLPFVEAMFDRVLTATPLAPAGARAELRELWRIMAPAGLAVIVTKARRSWAFRAPGWRREALAPVLGDVMFEVLDWQIETLPDRQHVILVGKRDGLRPALVGRETAPVLAPATATE